MQTNKAYSRVHFANLATATGVALVRYNEADELVACAGAVARFGVNPTTDQVFTITPAALWAAFETVESNSENPAMDNVAPEVLTLSGPERMGRYRCRIEDNAEYTALIESASPGGRWAALVFGRGKTRPQFEVTKMALNQQTWNVTNGDEEPVGSKFVFATSAALFASSQPTAWHMLKTMAFSIGGVDCDCFPPVQSKPAEPLLVVQRRERDARQQRAKQRYGNNRGPGVSFQDLYNRSSPEQRAILDQLIQQKRAEKNAKK
jgi:hypothetical protein